MKIAVVSGKGGTGKSMIASSLAIYLKNLVALDCDPDGPNLSLWLDEQDFEKEIPLKLASKPKINNEFIDDPKKYASKCKFNALKVKKGKLKLLEHLCEGCGACKFFCPHGSVEMKPQKTGFLREKETKFGFPLISGLLIPGQMGSGEIVDKIIKKGEDLDKENEVIDSPAGIGCPLISSLKGVDLSLVVAEPSKSSFVDIKRVMKIINHFDIEWRLIINKWDTNKKITKQMKEWAKDNFLGKISFDKKIFKAANEKTPVIKTDLKAKEELENIFKKIEEDFF